MGITDFDESLPIDFVFGSNELGLHGGGAARVAREQYGARYERKGGPGQGFGPQGNSFGIPTCSKPTGEPDFEIEFEKLAYYVECFKLWARLQVGRRQFKVTQIGCGLAGWTAEQVAPLFADAPDNCYFDTAWHSILGSFAGVYGDDSRPRKYWGHVA